MTPGSLPFKGEEMDLTPKGNFITKTRIGSKRRTCVIRQEFTEANDSHSKQFKTVKGQELSRITK